MTNRGDTQQHFGSVAKVFHWGMAVVVLGLLAMGFWMVSLPAGSFKFALYGFHKSFGLLVLGFGIMRLFWRFISGVPAALPTHRKWEKVLSKTIHSVLYISIIGMPLSGLFMSFSGEYPVRFFGLFDVPPLGGKNEALFELMKAVHELFAFMLTGALGLHILGALKHHVLDRDETLVRMGGNLLIGLLGLVFLSVPAGFAVLDLWEEIGEVQEAPQGHVTADEGEVSLPFAVSSGVQKWVIDPAESSIVFRFDQYGQSVSGVFERWSAGIVFDSEKLESSAARVEIDVSSLKTGSADRDEQARGEDWFAAEQYPKAVFESESFEDLGANRYQVFGHLSLRGVQLPVSFPFHLVISDQAAGGQFADMEAGFTLERLRFGIGQNQWKATDAIGNSVQVELKLRAVAN
ncbi:MAG: YceI family protein [Alphaproteobacteria bacterium]